LFINRGQMKISKIILNDIKLNVRYYSLLWIIFLWVGFTLLLVYFSEMNKAFLLYFTTVFLLFLYETIINNMYAKAKNEFWIYNILPLSYNQILLAKNISAVICTLFPIISLNIILTFLLKLSLIQFAKSICFIMPTLTILLTIGNYHSIRSQIGEDKRDDLSLNYPFIHQLSLLFSIVFYFLLTKVIKKEIYLISYMIFSILIYISTLKIFLNLLLKKKYQILESE